MCSTLLNLLDSAVPSYPAGVFVCPLRGQDPAMGLVDCTKPRLLLETERSSFVSSL